MFFVMLIICNLVEVWLNDSYNVDISDQDVDPREYYAYLQQFTDDGEHQAWKDLIVFDDHDNPTLIKGAKVELKWLFFRSLNLKRRYPREHD